MKKTPTLKPKPKKPASAEMREEYDFDYSKARPNRFAGRGVKEGLVVVLDEDIAKIFKTPDSVKAILRALIENMPINVKSVASKQK